ncbi:hypothetical protein O0L34_g8070 [Tuta absoluta]|nr:hypothetical protein O0L34_g8070 [Tuta absoluta]
MSTSCNSCKLLVNELLAFIQCKSDVIDEVSLVKLCFDNFSESDIENAKAIVCNLTGRHVSRKGDGKTKRNLQDIVSILKSAPDTLPTFVTKDLHKLPPVCFDHIDATSLLKNLLVLQRDLNIVKNNYVQTCAFEELRDQCSALRSSVEKLTSVETAKVLQESEKDQEIAVQNPLFSSILTVDAPCQQEGGSRKPGVTVTNGQVVPPAGSNERARLGAPHPAPEVGRTQPARKRRKQRKRQAPSSLVAVEQTLAHGRAASSTLRKEPGSNDNSFGEESYVTVVPRKKRKSLNKQGTAQLTSSNIKVAPQYSYIYASRFAGDTTEKNLQDFIRECGESTINIERLKSFQKSSFASFKITVLKEKVDIFLSEQFWPAGIQYRLYTFRKPVKYSSFKLTQN